MCKAIEPHTTLPPPLASVSQITPTLPFVIAAVDDALREVQGVSDLLKQLIDDGGEIEVYKLRPLRSSLRVVCGTLTDNLDALEAIHGAVRA